MKGAVERGLTTACLAWALMGFTTVTTYGCGHAKHVEDPGAGEGQAKEPSGNARERGRSGEASERTAPRTERPAGVESSRKEEPADDGEAKTKKNDTEQKVPLARSPGGMMSDGAIKELQAGLQKAGLLESGKNHVTGRLDAPTEKALRKFQETNDLPATGVPDRATVRALGLDPDEAFKSAAP